MLLLKSIAGGLVGGVVGAVIWAVFTYLTNIELGLIAWGIGVLVGLGASIAAGEHADLSTGVCAGAIAIAAVVAGKYAVVQLAIGGAFPGGEEAAIVGLADEVVNEWESDGRRVAWPPGIDLLTAIEQADYPPAIWEEATHRYEALPMERQQELQRYPFLANESFVLSCLADEVAERWEQEGMTLSWPYPSQDIAPTRQEHYPEPVWEEAQRVWDLMSVSERESLKQDVLVTMDARQDFASDQLSWYIFLGSFNFFDVIWLVLAVGSAFKLGSAGGEPAAEVE